MLAKIAKVCEEYLRPSDVIGRFGGEEFVVALPNNDEGDLDSLIMRADQMLYVGKRGGSNQVVVCRDVMEED